MSKNKTTVSDVVIRNAKKVEPIIVEFQHAVLKPEAVSSVEGAVFSRDSKSSGKQSDNRNDLVATCKVDGMTYQGNVQASKEKKTLLALRNKRTNQVRLVEVSSVSLLPLVTYPASTNPLVKEANQEMDKKTRQENARNLVHNFGGLRGQRMYDQAERLGVKAETVKANLEDAAGKSNIKETDIVPEKNESFDYLLPPCNRNAVKPSEVYQESDIVTEGDLKALEGVAKICLESDEATLSDWENQKIYSSYFTTTLRQLRKQQPPDVQHKVKLLVYTECLIKFSNLKAFALRRKDPLPEDFPYEIRQKVINVFAPRKEGSSERQFTKVDRERCICHVIVLGLIIGDFSVDLKPLSNSLHLGTDKLMPLVRVVGAQAVVDKSTGQHLANLEIPLAQPPRQGGIKRKRGTK